MVKCERVGLCLSTGLKARFHFRSTKCTHRRPGAGVVAASLHPLALGLSWACAPSELQLDLNVSVNISFPARQNSQSNRCRVAVRAHAPGQASPSKPLRLEKAHEKAGTGLQTHRIAPVQINHVRARDARGSACCSLPAARCLLQWSRTCLTCSRPAGLNCPGSRQSSLWRHPPSCSNVVRSKSLPLQAQEVPPG